METGYDASYSVYISGPMRGKVNLNRPTFDAVARHTAARGWKTFNPAEEDESLKTAPFSVCIKKDVEALLKSNAIVLLPGWRQSEGARFEAEVAKNFDLDFWEAVPCALGASPIHGYTLRATSAPEIGAEGIDQEARKLVYGARAATYGHPRGDFDRVAKMWGAILNTEVTAEQVAIMMVAFKLARLSQTPTHHDSQVDTIGYMLCLARLQEDPTEAAAWAAGVEAAGTEPAAWDNPGTPVEPHPDRAEIIDTERKERFAKAAEHAADKLRAECYEDRNWAGEGFHTPYEEKFPHHARGGINP